MHLPGTRILLRLIERVGLRIENLYRAILDRGAAHKRSAPRQDPDVALDLFVLRQLVISGGPSVLAVFIAIKPGVVGTAQPGGSVDQRVEYRLQIEGRAADDLQNIAG